MSPIGQPTPPPRPSNPYRVLDTRSGIGGTTGRIAVGQKLTLAVPAAAAANATSVVLNLTADGADVDGFVTAYPCDATAPRDVDPELHARPRGAEHGGAQVAGERFVLQLVGAGPPDRRL